MKENYDIEDDNGNENPMKILFGKIDEDEYVMDIAADIEPIVGCGIVAAMFGVKFGLK